MQPDPNDLERAVAMLAKAERPIIMAGGKQMGHKAGQFISYDEQKNNLANLFVRIANSMDVPIEKFGDSTGIPMSELFG